MHMVKVFYGNKDDPTILAGLYTAIKWKFQSQSVYMFPYMVKLPHTVHA